MKIVDVLKPECIVAQARCTDKTDLLQQVARCAKQCPVLEHVSEDTLVQALLDRETLGSTGFGQGIAIPHCRLEQVTECVAGMMTLATPVEFAALDEQPVNLVIFIVGPKGGAHQHLKVLSSISHTLLKPGVTQELLSGMDAEIVYASLIRHTHAHVETPTSSPRVMIDLTVHNSDLMRPLLEAVTAIETAFITILDAERPAVYLADVPLFADFWRDDVNNFCKVIRVVLPEGLVNECVRRVDVVAKGLDTSSDILLTATKPLYTLGTLY